MPAVPTGGLSIFVNIAIVLIGYIVKSLKKMGFHLRSGGFIYNLFVDKKFDNYFRRILGYGVAVLLFVMMFSVTSFSIYKRIVDGSNIQIVKEQIEKVRLAHENSNEDQFVSLESKGLVVKSSSSIAVKK